MENNTIYSLTADMHKDSKESFSSFSASKSKMDSILSEVLKRIYNVKW